MKLIVAHLPNDALESARTDLLALGVPRMTMSHVHSSGPESSATLQSRGLTMQRHMRPELRVECVVTASESAAVVSVLRAHASTRWGLGGRVAVLELEELHEDSARDEMFVDDPRRDVRV